MEQMHRDSSIESDVEFLKGCPICERGDPELEQLLEEFAQLLYEIMLADEQKKCAPKDLGTLTKAHESLD
jgi:hypothetical protein